jgi:hypothetical protein
MLYILHFRTDFDSILCWGGKYTKNIGITYIWELRGLNLRLGTSCADRSSLLGWCFKLGHDCLIPRLFQFVFHYHRVI